MIRHAQGVRAVRQTRFPISLFFVILGVVLLMSGVHQGFLLLMETYQWDKLIQTLVPIIYWALIALGLTLYTRHRMKKAYDEPMKQLAEATAKVASGDFSVYVPPLHTEDKQDYLDVMLTDFNKMVAELGSIETLKTDFFSNVSHEIKTPIAQIQSSAEMLCSGHLTDAQVNEYAESIRVSTRKLSSLITNMLKLNKLEKQTIRPMPERYDLSAQLCECALQFEDAWEKKGIDFVADVEERTFVMADPGLMELVWTNLLSNAIKFTHAGGTVTLRQFSDRGRLIVEISDTGCGMSEQTIAHIFDKFYQGDTSHATEGNGLGLALVWRILQLTDGAITAQSTQGEGSVFTVTLPVHEGGNSHE